MLTGKARYYIDRLAEEYVRLVNAVSVAAEDAALAKIGFYRDKLGSMGVVYDVATRSWVMKEGASERPLEESRDGPGSFSAKKNAADWELHFHEYGRESGKRMALSADQAHELLRVIQSKHCNVDVWRDGRLICTVFNNRA